MKRLLFFGGILFWSTLLSAQSPNNQANRPPSGGVIPGTGQVHGKGSIIGSVEDSINHQQVPFATIALVSSDNGKTLDGTICDDKGKFTITKIKSGNYKIIISFIGYKSKTIDNIKISDKKDAINLGSISISQSVQLLKEVTVEGQRALIEEKVDRTVYNAENDATNRGGDATDVLRKVPMLSVDLDGNVSLRGSQSVKVLINNKPSTIAANSIADALKQIPADLIKSVEVITSPSAKYDAEGSAGIINIITKKNSLQGFSLNANGSAGIRGSNLGLNGNYRKGKMSFSLGGFGRVGYNVTGSFKNSQQTNNGDGAIQLNSQKADTRSRYGFGQYTLGWDYDINEHNSISSSVLYGFRNNNSFQDHLITQSFQSDTLFNTSTREVKVSDLSGTVDVNLNYTHTFKKPQQEFSISSLYSRNNRTNDFVNTTLANENLSIERKTKNQNESFNQEITVQADFQTPIGKKQILELGAKDIIRHVTSDYKYFVAFGSDGPYTLSENASLSNIFNYDQNVISSYLSYTLSFLKNYSLKGGLRYEYTTINAHFDNQEDIAIPSYGTLVPSLNISKKLSNGNTLKASYNRRIQRPSLQFLNPNLQSSNPLFVTIGNPNLSPEFTNNFELAYSTYFKATSLTLSTFVRNTNNSIQSVRDVVPTGDTIRTTYQNIGQENAYGFSLFANINISNKFTLNGGTDVFYAILKNNVPDPLYNASNEGWVANGRISGTYNFTKGWGLQAFAFYRARQVQLQGYQGGFGIYSLSLKKDLKNKKGSIGFGAENFFTPAFKVNNRITSPILTQNSTNVMHLMNFKINFNYRIGKLSADDGKPRKRRRSVSNDDLKDGGGDGSQTGGGGQQQQSQPSGPPQGQGQKPGQGQGPAQAPQQKPGQTPGARPGGQ